MMSKGSKQRPTDKDKFDANYDRIFGEKKKVEINDEFWIKQGYRLVDGNLRNQVYINNLAWRDPGKYKELEPKAHKELDGMGAYRK